MEDIMTDLTTEENDAFALLQAATRISNARATENKSALAVALNENMQLWMCIQRLTEREDSPLSAGVKANLSKLADFVVSKTLSKGCDVGDATLDAMENMNLQIAEGLLENGKAA